MKKFANIHERKPNLLCKITTVLISCRRLISNWILMYELLIDPSYSVQDTEQCLKARHVLGILGFFGIANVYAMRVNLSVAIMAMVNNTGNRPIHNASSFDFCPVSNSSNSTNPQVGLKKKYILNKLLSFYHYIVYI